MTHKAGAMVPECADTQDLLGGPARGPQPTGYMRTGRVDSGVVPAARVPVPVVYS